MDPRKSQPRPPARDRHRNKQQADDKAPATVGVLYLGHIAWGSRRPDHSQKRISTEMTGGRQTATACSGCVRRSRTGPEVVGGGAGGMADQGPAAGTSHRQVLTSRGFGTTG
jgi:hypothetical protein